MTIPAHKQTDPDKLPGQIVNPINTDLMDDMGQYAEAASRLTRRGNPVHAAPYGGNGTSALDLAKRATWGCNDERLQRVTTAVCAIKRALAQGAKLEDILRLL